MIRAGFGFSNAEYVENSDHGTLESSRDENDYSLVSSRNPFFSQLNNVLKLGYTRPLNNGDLGTLPPDADIPELVPKFFAALEEEKSKPLHERRLWLVLVKTVGWVNICLCIGLGFIGSACNFAGPLLLKAISKQLAETDRSNDTSLWALIGLVFFVPSFGSVSMCHSSMLLSYFGVKVRNVLTFVVFDRIFKLSSNSLESGEVINIINVDIKAMELIFSVIGTLVVVPVVILCDLLLIYWQVGFAAFIGLSYCLVIIPVSMYLIKTVGGKFKERLKIGDKRLKHINEIFQGIRVIKFFAWEDAFIAKIEVLRDAEQAIARFTARLTSLALYMQQSLPAWIPIIIFSAYIALGNELDGVQAFVVLQLVMLLAGPLNKLMTMGNSISMVMASAGRVSQFLFKSSVEIYVNVGDHSHANTAVELKDATLGWNPLRHITESDSLGVSLHHGGEVGANERGSMSSLTARSYEMVRLNDDSTHTPLDQSAVVSESVSGPSEDHFVAVDRGLYTIRNMSISIKKGQLVAIVGSIGSGKSSLLSSLLNELHLHGGTVNVRGTIAYHQQNSWIFNSSLKNNILFGREFDEQFFQSVVRAASLEADLATLRNGWDTEIGEKGINLSGGQKARVSFSRALYSKADVYLLDDPLSAVDAHVGHQMFHEGIKVLLSGKTVLLVTHQTQYLKDCDLIVVMADGKVSAMGSFDELAALGLDFQVKDFPTDMADVNSPISQKAAREAIVVPVATRVHSMQSPKFPATPPSNDGRDSGSSEDSSGDRVFSPSSSVSKRSTGDGRHSLMTSEHKAKGKVRWKTYWYYISRGRPEIYVLMILVVLCSQVLSTSANLWLSAWGDASTKGSLSRTENYYYLNRYTILAVAGSCTGLINMNLNVEHRTKAAKYIHKELLSKILSAPVSFFETTPLGRIMNVFSNDIRTIDLQIGMSMAQFIVTSGQLLGTTAILAGTTTGTFIVVLVPLLALYSYFQSYFQKSNLELKRLDSIANSPIVSQFTEVLSGITSVRAYSAKERYFRAMNKAVMKESTIYYLQQMLDNWKQIRLDISGSVMSLFVYILAVSTQDFISARLLLVAVTYSNILPTQCSNMVSIMSTVESSFNSVERIMYYVQETESEEAFKFPAESSSDSVSSDHAVSRKWPNIGEVVLEDVVAGYRDGPDVLKSITATIHSQEKIGVVGRSGSGKSTLMLALFRLEKLRRGKIVIDGVDISSIPLKLLRSRLGIIPQDPVLWAETLRFNLDPFNLHTDLEIWEALDAVCMKDVVLAFPNRLNHLVSENGSNFSAGQRQLVCFARTLLKKPKILVLDEATASVDNETDSFIQSAIRSLFSKCTVLTIAHRLNTVLDSDKIMVLDNGSLVEFDSVNKLLNQDNNINRAEDSLQTKVFKQLYQKFVSSR